MTLYALSAIVGDHVRQMSSFGVSASSDPLSSSDSSSMAEIMFRIERVSRSELDVSWVGFLEECCEDDGRCGLSGLPGGVVRFVDTVTSSL